MSKIFELNSTNELFDPDGVLLEVSGANVNFAHSISL